MDYVFDCKSKFLLLIVCLLLWIKSSAQQWQQGGGIYGGNTTSFAVNGTKTFASTYGGGVFLSQDNGASWVPVNSGLYNLYVNVLTFVGNTLFAGTWNSGVFRSEDMGVTWTQVSMQGLTSYTVTSLTAIGSTLYAGSFGGVFRLDASGAFWLPVNSGLTELSTNSLTSAGGKLYVGTNSSGVFVSSNGGNSWTPANDGFTEFNLRCLVSVGNNLYASNGVKVFVWNDSNSAWSLLSTLPSWIVQMGVSNGTLFVSGYADGVYMSTNNGTSWTLVGAGIPSIYISSIGSAGANVLIGTQGGGVYLSSDNGGTWSAGNNGMNAAPVMAIAETGNYLFAGTAGSGVYRSQDGGENWSAANSGITQLKQFSSLIVKGTKIFAGTGTGRHLMPSSEMTVYMSDNNGDSWTEVRSGLPTGVSQGVSSFASLGSDLFVGIIGGGVYHTSNDGASWTASGLSGYDITSLATVNNTLFAGSNGSGVFSSTDNGATWTPVNTGLPELLIMSLVSDGHNLYAGTFTKGILRSSDNGTTWTSINLPTNYPVRSMTLRNGYLFVFFQDGGVYISSDLGESWCIQTNNQSFFGADAAVAITNNGSFIIGTENGLYFLNNLATPSIANPIANISVNGFTAKWTKSAGATSYLFDFSPDNFVNQTELNVFDSSKNISGLSSNVYYKVRVRAVNGCVPSVYSDTVTLLTLLPAPKAYAATSITTTSFNISWSKVLNVTSYSVDVSTDNFNSFVSGLSSKSMTDTTLSVNGIGAGTSFQYRVRAINSEGNPSVNSNTISVLTIPAPPIEREIAFQSGSTFIVSWRKMKGASSYLLDVSQDNFTSFLSGLNSLPVSDSSKQVQVMNAGIYQFRVRATNSSGVSDYSNTVILTLLPPPIASAATSIAVNSFTLSWSKVSNASNYAIDVSTDNFNSFVAGLSSKIVTDTALNLTGLSGGTSYQCRVRAVNSVGIPSANSNIVVALTIPATPIAKEVVQANNSFLASWKQVKGATGYFLDVSQDNFISFFDGFNSLQLSDSSKQIPFIDAGIYQFRVRATNASGISGYSNVVTLTIAGISENVPTLTLYPNPSTDYIFIQGANNSIVGSSITNSLGQQMQFELERDGNLFRSDVRILANGVYILEVQTPSGISRLKFVKN